MAAEHRRVIAETPAHAHALAQNQAKQGFVVESRSAGEWVLRKQRRRGDITVTIVIRQPVAAAPGPWGPPTGPRAG
jgi:hypothetical protein